MPAPQVVRAVSERTLDADDRVRLAACRALCELAAGDRSSSDAVSAMVTRADLEAVADRLRDRKLPVRREVAAQLATVYRARCDAAHATGDADDTVIWIPSRLLAVAVRFHSMEVFLLSLRLGLAGLL